MGFGQSYADGAMATESTDDVVKGEHPVYVSLELHKGDGLHSPEDFSPYVYGSDPMVGCWDTSKAIPLKQESVAMWELVFIVPPNHQALEFKFLLKAKENSDSCVIEEGPNRFLHERNMEGSAGSFATFKMPGADKRTYSFPVSISAEQLSPFTLAACWRYHKENLQSHSSMVQGIADVNINFKPPKSSSNVRPSGSEEVELDLHHYEVPAPASGVTSEVHYAADATENPRGLQRSPSLPVPLKSHASTLMGLQDSVVSQDWCVSIKDVVALDSELPGKCTEALVTPVTTIAGSSSTVESRSIGTNPLSFRFEDKEGFYVNRGVGGSPKFVRLGSDVSLQNSHLQLDGEAEDMPEAAGAVAAAAVADRLLGPKERRQLAIVLVGLPARGKTFTAAKLTRYLRWLGHDTKHFNVGKYRRLKIGCSQTADFFRADNQEGVDARNEVAMLAMEDMLAWMEEGGQVGVFDATNSTRSRRNMILKMAEGKCKVIFLETICNDQSVIDQNVRLKIQQSPDYADIADYEEALEDFKTRLTNYEKVYEPVSEGSYIKMIDMVSGQGGQLQVKNISGYLPGRIVFFLVNTHITPRPILLTRHGESQDNLRGRIGGDPDLSEAGEKYALQLADFVNKRLKKERTASIWTSTLQRTILTAHNIVGFPKVQWRALDEINAGVCDGMTYDEIKETMPDEYVARKLDKLRYRYPRGESYLDVIQRLEPVIIELERQRSPVVVIAHQAVLRALYAYFADKPLKEIPHIEVPLHTVIEIHMGVTGVQEKRYKLM